MNTKTAGPVSIRMNVCQKSAAFLKISPHTAGLDKNKTEMFIEENGKIRYDKYGQSC